MFGRKKITLITTFSAMLQPDYDQLVANGEETGMAEENHHLIPLNWGY